MEFCRKLYTRGSSFETTIPKPLLFNINTQQKNAVHFIYDAEKARWYLEILPEEKQENTALSQPKQTNSDTKNSDTIDFDANDSDTEYPDTRESATKESALFQPASQDRKQNAGIIKKSRRRQ